MPFAIVFLIGVLCGVGLAYYFAGIAAMRERLAELERAQRGRLDSDQDRQG